MLETIYKDSVKEFTIGQAMDMYWAGLAMVVNDGKDIIVIIEEEN